MILCCGEALIDFVPLSGGDVYRPCPGGSIYNIALGLGRLETPVSFFSKLSKDFFGDMLAKSLDKNGVDTSYCPRTDAPTTLAFVSLPNEEKDDEPQYAFYAKQSADRSLAEDELPEKLSENIKALHFGSISLAMEPGATSLETLMKRESGNRIVSLDPNIRSSLMPDKKAYFERFEKWIELVDSIKLSQADMDWLYPDEKTEAIIARWFDMGINLCILTLGSTGAKGYTPNKEPIFAPTPKIEVSDTIGAGDAFLSATLAYLHKLDFLHSKKHLQNISTEELSKCLTYANRAAAINCSREGANPPYKNELEPNNA